MTHSAIAELSPFTDALTLDEMEELVEAAQNNNQIAWILTDEDVRHFHELEWTPILRQPEHP
jgi:hypothetical protein